MNAKTVNKIKTGQFKLKQSIYPDLFVKDYPHNAESLAYLDKLWHYHTSCSVSMMSQNMLNAILEKKENIRCTLRQLKNGSVHNNSFFTFPVC
jgi:hypothetical protein